MVIEQQQRKTNCVVYRCVFQGWCARLSWVRYKERVTASAVALSRLRLGRSFVESWGMVVRVHKDMRAAGESMGKVIRRRINMERQSFALRAWQASASWQRVSRSAVEDSWLRAAESVLRQKFELWMTWGQDRKSRRQLYSQAARGADIRCLGIALCAWIHFLLGRHTKSIRNARAQAFRFRTLGVAVARAWRLMTIQQSVEQKEMVGLCGECLSVWKVWHEHSRKLQLWSAAASHASRLRTAMCSWRYEHAASSRERKWLATHAAFRHWQHWLRCRFAFIVVLDQALAMAGTQNLRRILRGSLRTWRCAVLESLHERDLLLSRATFRAWHGRAKLCREWQAAVLQEFNLACTRDIMRVSLLILGWWRHAHAAANFERHWLCLYAGFRHWRRWLQVQCAHRSALKWAAAHDKRRTMVVILSSWRGVRLAACAQRAWYVGRAAMKHWQRWLRTSKARRNDVQQLLKDIAAEDRHEVGVEIFVAWCRSHVADSAERKVLAMRAAMRQWRKWLRHYVTYRADLRQAWSRAEAHDLQCVHTVLFFCWQQAHISACSERKWLATRATVRHWRLWLITCMAWRSAVEYVFAQASTYDDRRKKLAIIQQWRSAHAMDTWNRHWLALRATFRHWRRFVSGALQDESYAVVHDTKRICVSVIRWWSWQVAWFGANLEASARLVYERRQARERRCRLRRQAVGPDDDERELLQAVVLAWFSHHSFYEKLHHKTSRESARRCQSLLIMSLEKWVDHVLPEKRAEILRRRRHVRFDASAKIGTHSSGGGRKSVELGRQTPKVVGSGGASSAHQSTDSVPVSDKASMGGPVPVQRRSSGGGGVGRWAYNDKYWDAAVAFERPLESSSRISSIQHSVIGSEAASGWATPNVITPPPALTDLAATLEAHVKQAASLAAVAPGSALSRSSSCGGTISAVPDLAIGPDSLTIDTCAARTNVERDKRPDSMAISGEVARATSERDRPRPKPGIPLVLTSPASFVARRTATSAEAMVPSEPRVLQQHDPIVVDVARSTPVPASPPQPQLALCPAAASETATEVASSFFDVRYPVPDKAHSASASGSQVVPVASSISSKPGGTGGEILRFFKMRAT